MTTTRAKESESVTQSPFDRDDCSPMEKVQSPSATQDPSSLPDPSLAKGPDVLHTKLWLVVPALLLSIFLPAIDQTITAVALPTIINDIGGETGYSWVGAAYLLASASCSPFYGKFSDIVGRKPVFMASWGLFLLGSALCGAAQNILWLAICRGIQGAGGGGIITLSMIAISDVTPLSRRGFYIGLVGTVWGLASVVGPTVGGAFADHVSWRWCFYVNLPIGGFLMLVMQIFLRLKPVPKKPTVEVLKTFDFIGLILAVAGTACLLVGLQLGKVRWTTPGTITLLVLGGVLGLGCALNECFTRKSPIIPPRLFSTRTTSAVLIGAAIHGFAVFAGSYYLPVYFQIIGVSATGAGVRMMGFSVVSSAAGSIAGLLTITRLGYRPIIWVSWMIAAVGYGLMITLSETTAVGLQELYIIIAGIGVGGLFQVPLIALHAAMPPDDLATSSAAFMLLRLIGSAVGVSVGDTIFGSEVRRRVASIAGYHGQIASMVDFQGLNDIEPETLRRALVHAYASSLSTLWILVTALVGVGFLLSLLITTYSLTSPDHPVELAATAADGSAAQPADGQDMAVSTVHEKAAADTLP